MAIADRATATSDGTGTSLTYAHSVAGTTNLAIWCAVDSFRSQVNRADPTSVTYAGAALTKIGSFLGGSGNDNPCSLWVKTAPATGSNNVVVTHSQSHDITAMTVSYSGVDQTTPNDAVQELDSADADPTHSVTSATDDLVVSFIMGWGWVGLGEDGDLTLRLENDNSSGINSVAVGDAPGAASVNASWTTTSFNDPFGLFSFNVNQAGAGGTDGTLTATQAGAATAASPNATLTAGAALTATQALAATAAAPNAALTGGAVLSAQAMAATADAPSATATGGALLSAQALAATAGSPAADLSAAAHGTLTATQALAATAAAPDAGLTAGAVLTATGAMAAVADAPDATLTAAVAGTLTATQAMAATADAPDATATGGALLGAEALAATAGSPDATLTGATASTLAAQAMAATALSPDAALTGGALFLAEALLATATSPNAALAVANALVATQALAATAASPAATLTGVTAATILAQAMAAAAAMPGATYLWGQTLTGETMAAVAESPEGFLSGAGPTNPGRVTAGDAVATGVGVAAAALGGVLVGDGQ